MAFSFVKFPHEVNVGDLRMVMGTFSNSEGSEGGVIQTGLHYVTNIQLQHTGSSVVTDKPVVKTPSESLGGIQRLPPDIEIVTVANTAGIWVATGK
jgi:hypothetical protein